MPTFTHVSSYPAPRSEVFAWHTRPGGFVRLTPPGLAALRSGPTDGINPGSELPLRVGIGPVGVDWLVRHVELVDNQRFVDEQVHGPFRSWRHEHDFSDGPDGGTVITDTVTWELPRAVPRSVVERQLAGLFAFRERQLRGDLALLARLGTPSSTVVVSGASGLVGTQLTALLTTAGHRVVRLVRRDTRARDELRWEPRTLWLPKGALEEASVVINLSGATIGGRFTPTRKADILRSRIDSTTTLAEAMAREATGATLVQASAIGGYGPRRPGELLTEDSALGRGSSPTSCGPGSARQPRPASRGPHRVPPHRHRAELGGGAVPPQVPLFLVGAGGRLAGATQSMSWIGLDDLARAYVHAAFTPPLEGAVNAVGPTPTTQQGFADALGSALHRPAWLPTPAFGPELILGSEGRSELIDTDQKISSAKLTGSGFRFGEPTLDEALRHALARP
ncbi:SDR family oxidoreductase [Tessaracoccus coleopterorum]|uniref:SDR family oxidoreductase n=1 Tax=Tessaracoccus coleopterorum TaxID=2714950 RepID=UPI0018D4AD2E|nr:DUF1731 domain-containing protein [Tessaracoccus coleopterorum]